MMKPEEYQWYVNLVIARHQYLGLTYEQGERVYKYEQDRDTYSDKYFFSAWEEWDYERTTFQEILDQQQFERYLTFLNENIQQYEQRLIELDNEKRNDVAYHEELIRFYETDFIPDFLKESYLLFGLLSSEKAKVEYLKAEYKRFLNDTKKEMLTSHFRYNRRFKPNELKASLLRLKLLYIFPDYTSFKHKMDEPTKAVAQHLKTKLSYLPDTTEELLTRKFRELRDFNDANFKKHHGDIRGWHVVNPHLTIEEEKEYRTMTLLLLNK